MVLLSFNLTSSADYLQNKLKISDDHLIEILSDNTESILRTLEQHEVDATFFIAGELLRPLSSLVQQMYKHRHEVAVFQRDASHDPGFFDQLTQIIGKSPKGLRIKKGSIDSAKIRSQGYFYVSQLQDTGLLDLLNVKDFVKSIYTENDLEIIPESRSPYTRLPYNETVFQYIPMKYYQNMVLETLKNSEYVSVYLNMLQFTDFDAAGLRVPFYRKYNTGKKLDDKLNEFLSFVNDNDFATSIMKDYLL